MQTYDPSDCIRYVHLGPAPAQVEEPQGLELPEPRPAASGSPRNDLAEGGAQRGS